MLNCSSNTNNLALTNPPMKNTEGLLEEQLSFIDLHLSRLKCLSCMILGLIKVRTVNLSELSLCFRTEVQPLSCFRRMQRFLSQVAFPYDLLSKYLWEEFQGKDPAVLSLDRTNWKFGKLNINILLLSICWKGFAVPLMWKVLGNKRGNSSQAERICLMRRFVSVIQPDHIVRLVADREFLGEKWLNWLDENHFHFIIRIRKNQYIEHHYGKEQRADSLFSSEKWKVLRKPRMLKGVKVYLGGQKLKTGDHLILVSNLPMRSGRFYYAKRWGIEVLFANLKKRGFNFENTHITHPERINTFIAVLALAYIWAVKMGEWIVEKLKSIPIKKHGRRASAIFRIGLDQLRRKLLNDSHLEQEILLLSCT